MRASITVTGIEVELVVPAGPFERIVVARYAGYLGAPEAAVCTLELEPMAECGERSKAVLMERTGATRFQVSHPSFDGSFELRGHGLIRSAMAHEPIDEALRMLFGLLAPLQDGLLLRRTTGFIEGGRAHVFIGSAITPDTREPRLASPNGYVMVRRHADGWMAGSTPFDPPMTGLPREASLTRLCTGSAHHSPLGQVVSVIEDNIVAGADGQTQLAVHHLAVALAGSGLWTPGLRQQAVPSEMAWR